jgi:AcrR family transcriptional regulator
MPKTRTVKSADERRTELLDAAVHLFDRKGFEATTVHDIAKAAGVAPGTVYLYFDSKERILRELHVQYHRTLQAEVAATVDDQLARLSAGTSTTRDALDGVVEAIVSAMQAHRSATNVICRYLPRMAGEAHDEDREVVAFIADTIEVGMAAGYLHTSDPVMTAHLLKACIYEPLTHQMVYGDPPELAPLVRQLKEFFFKVLAVPAEVAAAAAG